MFIEALIDNPNGAKVTVGNVAKSATVLALEVVASVGSRIDGQGRYSIDLFLGFFLAIIGLVWHLHISSMSYSRQCLK